jgi:Short C-terminal domain
VLRRMGRPGLVGTMARTAVIAGTATAVSGGMTRRANARAQQKAEAEAYEQQQEMAQMAAMQAPVAPPPAAPAAAPAADDNIAKLQELANLKAQGVLTEEEFTAAKAKLLGI